MSDNRLTAGAEGAGRRSVVVTGAGMGIGYAVAERLVADGYAVVGVDRNPEALAKAAEKVGLEPLEGDIIAWETHERAADRAEELGRLVGWVNNAGVDWVGAAHEIDAKHIDEGLRLLLNGPMYGMCVAVRRMLPARHGSIVNLASVQGVVGFPRYPVYDAAKAGVTMASKQIAVDYAPFGIRSNAVLPGVIETPMTYQTLDPSMDPKEAIRREGEQAPILRPGQPREVAALIAFLISDESSFITGAQIHIDGGMTARAVAFPPFNADELPRGA